MFKYNSIVLAAGKGKRMNAGENKQFIMLGEKPLIIHTLMVFANDDWCSSIFLVVNKKERKRMEELLVTYPLKKPVTLVEGGQERQDSVYMGLKKIEDRDNIVFIHDGARPFVQQRTLHELAEVTKERQAALLAVPVTDTIKQLDGNSLTTLDRSTLWAAQTPQAFTFDVIYEAHKKAASEKFIGTDDASLVERIGHNVAIVRGSYDNIKLTTPEDLKHAFSYLKE